MRERFETKHIRELLGNVSKERVTYLANKVPIKPEIEESEGTGRSHVYSFRNALQFMVAHHLNYMGSSILGIRFGLDGLQMVDGRGFNYFKQDQTKEGRGSHPGQEEIQKFLFPILRGIAGKVFTPGAVLPLGFGLCEMHYVYKGKKTMLPYIPCIKKDLERLDMAGVVVVGLSFLDVNTLKTMVEEYSKLD
jgi:hypothetical protein